MITFCWQEKTRFAIKEDYIVGIEQTLKGLLIIDGLENGSNLNVPNQKNEEYDDNNKLIITIINIILF